MKIIDGIKCYSPDLALINDGFSAESFEKLANFETTNFWFCSRNEIIGFLVRKFSANKGKFKFLEMGCGTGFVLTELAKIKNIDLLGSDIHVTGLKYAQKRLTTIELVQLDAREMPYKKEFDAIGAFDVLEHIEEDELVLENLFVSLKPQGFLYLSVPQYKFMWSHLDDIAYHKRRYSKTELLKKIEKSGFELKYCGSFVFTLFPLMLISRLLQKKTPANINRNRELEINSISNIILTSLMKIDTILIKLGIQLPFGGSLLLVAQKPTYS